MPELMYRDQSSSRSGFRARDASPDSVIFTLESNFSLFSSASASVDRCSFASDAHDRDSCFRNFSGSEVIVGVHLAGHEALSCGGVGGSDLHETSSGPDRDPDPNKLTTVYSNTKPAHAHSHSHSRLMRKAVQKEESKATIEVEDDTHLLDSARSSFSLALKECQERRSRSEAISKKPDRRRPASLDLNNVIAASSPRLGAMRKSSISSHKSGAFPSPGTPNYRHTSVGMQKGWSSERVPLHTNGNRRQVNAGSLPFNNGRTLPSKWEDAERWIFSPVSGDGAVKTSLQPSQRRPKSKSGPLGPPGIAYYSLYSPAMPVFEGDNAGNFVAGSPFSAGVIAVDGLSIRSNGHGLAFPVRTEHCMARSVSVHGCSEVLAQPLLPSQDEKLGGVKDAGYAATNISSAVSRRDMATQMSPEGSNHSPPSGRASFSTSTPSALAIVELQSNHSSNSEVRDVQVDERVTVTRWSKKHRARNQGKSTEIIDDWRKKTVDARSPGWDVSDAAKSISKAKREEAKITAWENLQKAKAEAKIRKLEEVMALAKCMSSLVAGIGWGLARDAELERIGRFVDLSL
ncbi:hypothetical protein GH714_013182 [Hevea brasiliensis]|uniref:Remorin C-terminal domain-containing protein n=2 Tax=Hevea brasiliensis TaxID=3981 RepID=A0A6A6NGW2_HEVBR|nr:hypothetical protein GH714_013182 [Hevea brasiliensis]